MSDTTTTDRALARIAAARGEVEDTGSLCDVAEAAARLPAGWWLCVGDDGIGCRGGGHWVEPDAMLPLDHAPDCPALALDLARGALGGDA